MRKISATATFLALGLGVTSTASAQALRGSDTLDLVTNDAIAACGVVGVTYPGGGSSAGQGAMTAGTPAGAAATQRIAPMSRPLNGIACVANARQLLIGLDGMAIVASNQNGGDSTSANVDPTDDCTDSIGTGNISINVPGCGANPNTGCDAANNYVFGAGLPAGQGWKDVLALIYGGQNHNVAAAQLIARERNPARIDCNNPVRRALADNFGALFHDVAPARACRAGGCTKLRHAFRRDDNSGTTDTFVTLVGLVNIPGFTTLPLAQGCEVADALASTTANPFCNAGTEIMNKGFSDNLDLDPIRRAALTNTTPARIGLEQVAEGNAIPNNSDAACPVIAQVERSCSQGRGIKPRGGVTAGAPNLRADLLTHGCLGLVLPISIPTNYSKDAAYPKVLCDTGRKQAVLPAPGIICPDGTSQPCNLPVHINPDGSSNFDCIVNTPLGATGIRDQRLTNLFPVDNTGHMAARLDNYDNPNIAGAAERRFSKAYYRIHNTQVDNSNAGAPSTGGPCQAGDATTQIGCLVKASPCSIGFAGREAVSAGNFAARMEDVIPSTANIQALVTGAVPVYPLSRTLWLNSFVAAPGIGFTSPPLTAGELALSNCMGLSGSFGTIDGIIAARNFTPVPASVTNRVKNCPAVFP